MKKSILFLFLFAATVSFTVTLGAPIKSPKKFGDIDMKNLEMTIYDRDSSAAAVYIFDWGNAYINYATSKLALEMHVRIKIINSQGFSYGNIEIPHHTKTPVMRFKGATYNLENGNLVESEVDKSMIFDEKVTSSNRIMKISFPDVREGSIIEYSYKIEIDDLFNLVPWYFQTSVPVMHSEYNLRVPNNFKYKILYGGFVPLTSANSKQVTERGGISATFFHWMIRNVPAMKSEPFMPEKRNFITRIEFELEAIIVPGRVNENFLTTWPKFEEGLIESENFYKITKQYNFLKDSVKAITEGKTGIAKISAIRNFVIRHVKWNKKERRMASDSPKSIYKEGEGNSADINLMMVALLKKAGFEAYPVIISTRSNRIITDYRPVASYYNYTIAWVKDGDKEYLLDATDPYLPAELLPARCINGRGRIIRDDKPSGWADLVVRNGSTEMIMGTLAIDEEGYLVGDIQISSYGYPAGRKMERVKSKGTEKFIEDIKKNRPEWDIEKYDIEIPPHAGKPFVEKIKCSIEGRVEDMGDILFLNPLLGTKWEENPFKGEKRIYPIDFVTSQTDRLVIQLKLPEGYQVDELPESVRIATQDKGIYYLYSVRDLGNGTVQIQSNLKINRPKFSQTEFEELKKFFEVVREKQSAQIVLKRST